MSALRKYDFPGNVRELEHAIEHAFVMCHGPEIRPEHLPSHILNDVAGTRRISRNRTSEKEVILEALRRYEGNRERTASELGDPTGLTAESSMSVSQEDCSQEIPGGRRPPRSRRTR
jgi:DNA-binding NtrC family response regulator